MASKKTTSHSQSSPGSSSTPSGNQTRKASKRRGKKAGKSARGAGSPKQAGGEPDLHDLFVEELSEFADSARQNLQLLELIAGSAETPDLHEAIEMAKDDAQHHQQIAGRMLERFAEGSRKQRRSKPLAALLTDTRKRLETMASGRGLDMFLITALQKAEHYDIALLGTLAAWAEAMEAPRAARVLDGMLHDKRLADRHLTRLAWSTIEQRGTDLNEDQGGQQRNGGRQLEQAGSGNGRRNGS